MRDARLKDIVERQRNGTWDGVPRGMMLVVDGDGVERLQRITKDEGADKSKDIRKSEEDTALFNLGGTNAASNKSGSDDDGLGQELDDLLNGMEVNPNGKGNVTPLQSEMGDKNVLTMQLATAMRRIFWLDSAATKTISRKTNNETISRQALMKTNQVGLC